MPGSAFQRSFAAGEIAPSLYGRADQVRFQTGLSTCRNFMVMRHGGVTNRPGTQFIAEVKDSSETTVLLKFVFNADQTYVIEAGTGYFRFCRNAGRIVVSGVTAWAEDTAYAVKDLVANGGVNYYCYLAHTSSLSGTPAAWAGATGYSFGDLVSHGGADYRCIEDHISADHSAVSQWADATGYTAADVVYETDGSDEYLFEALSNHTSDPFTRPGYGPDWETVWEQFEDTEPGGRIGWQEYWEVVPASDNEPGVGTDWEDYWHALTGTIYEIPTPYQEADLAELRYIQSGDVVTLTHRNYAPRELRRTGHTAWELVTVVTSPGTVTPGVPFIAAPPDPAWVNTTVYLPGRFVSAVAASGGTLNFRCHTEHTATAGTDSPGYDTDWPDVWATWPRVTRSYRISAILATTEEEGLPGTAASRTGPQPDIENPWVLSWVAVSGASGYRVYCDPYGNGHYGLVGESDSNTFRDLGFDPDFLSGTLEPRSLFAASGGFPAVATYYQQRRLFASSDDEPETVWGSRIGFYSNFSSSSPVQDDDMVEWILAANQVQEVRHLVALKRLLVLTSGAEWQIRGDADGVLTPVAINADAEGYYGAAEVTPVVIGNSIVYVQARGSIIRDLRYLFESDGYAGNDLTIFSPHLTAGYTLSRMDYAQNPHSILWIVRSDGTLLGLTYLREHELVGWHRHDTDGTFEDVVTVPEGEEDAPYMVVRRTVNEATVRYIERMYSRQHGVQAIVPQWTAPVMDLVFLDSALSYDGRNAGATTMALTAAAWTVDDDITITASASFFVSGDVGNTIVLWDADGNEVTLTITAYASGLSVTARPDKTVPAVFQTGNTLLWGKGVDTLSGLDHLEAMEVGVLADGQAVGEFTVASGAITLSRPHVVIHAGLPVTADFVTLDVDSPGTDIRDRRKLVKSVSLLVESSRGLMAGTGFTKLREHKATLASYGAQIPLFTGLVEVLAPSIGGDVQGRIYVRHTQPLPLTILAVGLNGETGD